MSQLLVFGVESSQTAIEVFELAGKLHRQHLLELADAAWVERQPRERNGGRFLLGLRRAQA